MVTGIVGLDSMSKGQVMAEILYYYLYSGYCSHGNKIMIGERFMFSTSHRYLYSGTCLHNNKTNATSL